MNTRKLSSILRVGKSIGVLVASSSPGGRRAAALALTATLAGLLLITGVAAREAMGIFRPFRVESGFVQSGTADPSLDARNKFFDPGLGTNGQSCATCHEADQGFSILVPFIQERFEASGGFDPLFRTNDTADRHDADTSTLEARRTAFSLFLELGIARIGKSFPAVTNFTVAPQNTPRFGPQPVPDDPQAAPGVPTLSLFRRPLVNTNVHFDSSVLWDGRASITNMPDQVKRAARGLLLAGGPTAGPLGDVSDADAAEVAAFMLGVFSAQAFDDNAGSLQARGAGGGVADLTDLAADPAAPCTPLAPPATCTPIGQPTMTLFDAWADLPNDDGRNEARAAVARGQALFNRLVCVGCHSVNNIGNNPSANFFIRLGLDSIDPNTPNSLAQLAAADPRVQPLLDRASKLPEFCLRPTSDPTPFSVAACGTRPTDQKTTDPGRAMVTGLIADIGRFKPPILRDLPVRGPFFHNAAAETLGDLVNFYNARFALRLTPQQHDDLVAFLRAL